MKLPPLRIVTVRRISQGFFLTLFLGLCAVTTLGDRWWQWSGWPVNLFLQLDPLVAIGTLISTGTVYRGLLWALVTVVLTILLGRWFCGWLCPFGTLHQLIGVFGSRGRRLSERIRRHQPHPAQAIKYVLLLFFLGAAAWGALRTDSTLFRATLQTGLLDPIPLLQRSVTLTFGAVADHALRPATVGTRYYEGAWLLGAVCLAALLMNLIVPRFYCRFVCPLGALLGLLGRYALRRIGRVDTTCANCRRCGTACEGACDPLGQVRTGECVLCFNCTDTCREQSLQFSTQTSATGELPWPSLSRRGALLALGSGLAAAPLLRLDALTGSNFRPGVLRPPGALAEDEFLARCIKCGQCMKICPSNIIQPALLQAGVEGLWTPVLNFRIGTSGCAPTCVACGHICPTAAIRPLSLAQKAGRGDGGDAGPVRLGLAFVDRGRCLPWAMGTPCIVCQEVCPVSPKAIRTVVTGEGLQRPVVDPSRCIGCGMCEHECPVSGLRAIRVTAENESRHPDHTITLSGRA